MKIFKSKSGIKNAINKLQQLNPNYNYKIKNIYRTTKISSYYYKEKMIQNNKSILMLSNNKQGVNNNIHDKRIVLLKKYIYLKGDKLCLRLQKKVFYIQKLHL